jgi:hypothetical protein
MGRGWRVVARDGKTATVEGTLRDGDGLELARERAELRIVARK